MGRIALLAYVAGAKLAIWSLLVVIGTKTLQKTPRSPWALARNQHGLVSRRQLLALGWSAASIKHRMGTGRLHPIWRGVYAIGRRELTREGAWMAAVLYCAPDACLSHRSAAALWGIQQGNAQCRSSGLIEISVPAHRRPTGTGIRVHRVEHLPATDQRRRHGIPVTSPVRTLVDLALCLTPAELERAINEADKHGLVDTDSLMREIEQRPGHRGVAVLRGVLGKDSFALTDSELERSFLRLVRGAGLPTPLTQQSVNGFRVDFFWPELNVVVETDGLRYHRTQNQQSKDRVRDQRHTAAGFVVLRFTHFQVAFEADGVETILRAVAERQRLDLLRVD
jgi:very-short-patch-repair endonuclease